MTQHEKDEKAASDYVYNNANSAYEEPHGNLIWSTDHVRLAFLKGISHARAQDAAFTRSFCEKLLEVNAALTARAQQTEKLSESSNSCLTQDAEWRGRIINCIGCPTIECTCMTELEEELLNKTSELIKAAGGGAITQALEKLRKEREEK